MSEQNGIDERQSMRKFLNRLFNVLKFGLGLVVIPQATVIIFFTDRIFCDGNAGGFGFLERIMVRSLSILFQTCRIDLYNYISCR